MTKVVLTGASGILGTSFRSILGEHEVLSLDRNSLYSDQLERLIATFGAEVLVNCAAHTDVEEAERQSVECDLANSILPAKLASICCKLDIVLAHFSSTGCYGDWKREPYIETDQVEPTTAHHRAKAGGEAAIMASGCEYLIFRTGWLFGGSLSNPKNFVWNRMKEAKRSHELTSDDVQRGCPTFVDDLAFNAWSIIQTGTRGLFNLTSHGSASRYDYIAKIIEFSGLSCEIKRGAAFKRLAPVSSNETALNDRLQALGLDQMRSWEDGLREYVEQLISAEEWKQC